MKLTVISLISNDIGRVVIVIISLLLEIVFHQVFHQITLMKLAEILFFRKCLDDKMERRSDCVEWMFL